MWYFLKLSEKHKKMEEEQQKIDSNIECPIKHNKIKYITNSILKEVKKEDRLIRQILYACFSAFGRNPINLAINAFSGSGKTYTINNIIKYFPDWFYFIITGATKKIVYYEPGIMVVQDEKHKLTPASVYWDQTEENIQKFEDKLKEVKTPEEKTDLKAKILAEKREQKYILENRHLLIDLNHKLFIFQDTPDPELLDTIMPLLSHDLYRTTYKHVQTTANTTKTESNILEGYINVIYCQAIDISTRERYKEHVRRFMVVNPDISSDKFIEAEKHIYASNVPKDLYHHYIITEEEIENTKLAINDIVKKMLDYTELTQDPSHPRDDENETLVPFHNCLPTEKGISDNIGVAKRIMQFLNLLPLINIDDRPKLYLKGKDYEQYMPIAIFDDLDETFFVNEFVFSGVKEYILEWYMKVFMPKWKEKSSANKKEFRYDFHGEKVQEKNIILYMHEITERHRQIYKDKNASTKMIRKDYLDNLVNIGFIDETKSELNPRESIFYPIVHDILDNYQFRDNTLKLIKKVRLKDVNRFPTRKHLYDVIKEYMTVYMNKINPDKTKKYEVVKLLDVDGTEITIDNLINKYYSNPDKYFTLDDPSKKVVEHPFLVPETKELLDYSGDVKTCDWCNEEIVPESYDKHREKCTRRPKQQEVNPNINIGNNNDQ